MTNKIPFLKDDLLLEDSWETLSVSDIDALFPDHFNGGEDFVSFWLAANGGYFTKGCVFYRDHFYDVSQDGYTDVEIESFYFIPRHAGDDSPVLLSIPDVRERRKRYSAGMKKFCETHLPFAGDGGDHDYWLDLKTGVIKLMIPEESEEAILIAPSFKDFCTYLQASRR